MLNWLEAGLIIGVVWLLAAVFIYFAVKLSKLSGGDNKLKYSEMAEQDALHIFDDEFREELKNRGRLHFEKIIGENAMFLQQDLRLTSSEINQHMRQEINKTLQEAFSKYEQSITDAKTVALESIQKTEQAVEKQREVMSEQLQKEINDEKKRIISNFEKNMAEIINHYVLMSIGKEMSLEDQLEYILGELENNKEDLMEDLNSGT